MTAVTITLLVALIPIGLTGIAYVSLQLGALRAQIGVLKTDHADLRADVTDLRKESQEIRVEINAMQPTLAKIEGQMQILIADLAAIKATTSN